MILKLSTGKTIDLPSEYSSEDRLVLVNMILAELPEEFGEAEKMFNIKYGQKQDNNRLVKIKLDILATYLIRGDEDYTDTIMSRYKETSRPIREMSFSQFKPELVDLRGWH